MKKLVLIIFCISFAIQVKAQTTGPTQPEAAGFAPIGADDMVNLYTGDFNYNIPLMVIPGPDGGYPINMFYNGNVGMDQAASWIGLGWNLNVGAIQRNLRGTPDDFKGDLITKEFYTKPSTTISFDISAPIYKRELAGADFSIGLDALNAGFSVYYNNYSGLGINTSLGAKMNMYNDEANEDGFSAGLGLSFGSQEGFSLSPSLSYDWQSKKPEYWALKGVQRSLALGFNLNSKQGFDDLNLSFENNRWKKAVYEKDDHIKYGKIGLGSKFLGKVSFASSAPISSIKVDRTSISGRFSFTPDPTKSNILTDNEIATISGSYSRSWITDKTKETPAYGAMYMSNWQDKKYDENIIPDFYRENEGPITKDNVLTPIPVVTYDIFSIQGHGVGGSFRAYLNSIGRLSDAVNKSTSTTIGLGLELGIGVAVKAGVDIDVALAGSNSGPWKRHKDVLGPIRPYYYLNELYDFKFNKKITSKPLFEPFYFKMIGEASALDPTVWNQFEEGNPIAFDINRRWDTSILAAKAQAHSTYNRSGNIFEGKENEERNPRTQNIEYFTKKDINGVYTTKHIVSGSQLTSIDYNANGQNHHLNGISVLKPNGVRYNYFLPAYNHSTEKVTFAIPDRPKRYNNNLVGENPKVIDQVGGRNVLDYAKVNNGSLNNFKTEDEFYSRDSIPAYAHTFFITSILSQDYVDIKNDGPSEDDLGTYVKMNYEEVPDYKWRFPFKGAYYSKGYLDNEEDDKASYQLGTKDLFYVKSIETKTHVAVFGTIDSKLYDADKSKYQRELVSISLYSKADPNWTPQFYLNASLPQPTPIQTVHLNQDYSLKQGVPNSSNQMVPALKELYFTYQNSTKGENAKYQFDYGYNPPYENHLQDRWGAYQPDKPGTNIKVNENPYTYQEESYGARDNEASAWLLNKITLPSKGNIEVLYEKDDYAYVQDKRATSFFEILGTGDQIYSNLNQISRTQLNDRDDEYIYFKTQDKFKGISEDNLNKEILAKYLVGIKNVRFRAFMDLKKIDISNQMAKDYVEGYAEIMDNSWGYIPDTDIGYFKVHFKKPKNTSTFYIHPFRLAAFQYIRKSRPDLGLDFGDISNIAPQAFGLRNLASMLNEASVLITGYYSNAKRKGWAKNLNREKPSYIRLNNPERKYGGGARVDKITLKSHDGSKYKYGQQYEYELPDGTSSGVAEWEPILGIEENPFTQPIWYNANNNGHKIIFSNEQSFSEEPLGAGLYPSASVGYSRVTVRNLEEEQGRVKFAQSGINISEFYTAKDFPTQADKSGALFAPYWAPVPIPFIGEQNTRYNGYSMGYSFTLNNAIYGRQKSVATFPYEDGEPTGEPIQKSVYKYKTLTNNAKALDNKVKTLRKEGDSIEMYMGKEIDFYIDEIEANTYNISYGGQFNISYQPPAQFLPSLWPKINSSRKGTRYLTTNKIVYNTPILEEVIQYKDGAKVSTKNLVFDHETGEPIITSVTNEWKQPIYTYNFPAHWSYEQMKGAYKNYRAELSIASVSSTNQNTFQLKKGLTISGTIPLTLLNDGDELIFDFDNTTTYYASDVDHNSNKFKLYKRDGTSAPFMAPVALTYPKATIVKSSYKNLQSTKKGKIVSLEDLSTYQQNDLYKQLLEKLNNGEALNEMRFYSECNLDYDLYYYPDDPSGSNFNFTFIDSETNSICDGVLSIYFPTLQDNSVFNSISASSSDLHLKYRFSTNVSGHSIDVTVIDNSSQFYGNTYRGILSFSSDLRWINNPNNPVLGNQIESIQNCRCPITILHADATEFSDNWDFNYSELDDQSTDISSSLSDIANNSTLGNPYAFGLKGIWRPKRTSAYLIDRLQTGTNGDGLRIDKDGEYKEFYWFDWTQPITYNEDYNWRWVNEVTKYNINGASKEGRNRLDIHAASLFGYNNHLVTASASNSKTTDIAFDGFEDYGVNEPITHGNLSFNSNSSAIYNDVSHTGNNSLGIGSIRSFITNTTDFFQPEPNKKYVISAWVYFGERGESNFKFNGGEVEIWENNILQVSIKPDFTKNQIIDGWMKIEGAFSTQTTNIEIRLKATKTISGATSSVFDDIRIQPFNSGMETYVYDPTNYRLRATLSNQNFATFYNYDEEGNLTQTKVETERGIKTISSNRNNIKQ